MDEMCQQLSRTRINPLHVVQCQDQRNFFTEVGQEGAHRSISPVPLHAHRPIFPVAQPGENRREVSYLRRGELGSQRRGLGTNPVLERDEEDAERQLSFEFGRVCFVDLMPKESGPIAQFVEKPGLPDSRSPLDYQDAPDSLVQLFD
jgi:hypothetical protein